MSTAPDTYGWKAHVTATLPGQFDRLHLARPSGDHMELIEALSDGPPVLQRVNRYASPDFQGFQLPLGVVQAITQAVGPQGPSVAEVRRLEEALAVERRRVDYSLGMPTP